MSKSLQYEGMNIGRYKTRRIMKNLKLSAIYPKPKNTSKPQPEHKIYPYLLRNAEVDKLTVNQVWSTDITYIRLAKGFVYLTAIIDWRSRYILSWKLSLTLETKFCVDALKEAMQNYGIPEIFNSDQGSQFTSLDFTSELLKNGVKISMDGKGRCLDNVYIERFWRSVKQEDVYLRGYESVWECEKGIAEYIDYYNNGRLHSSLDYRNPKEIYFDCAAKNFVAPAGATANRTRVNSKKLLTCA